MPVQTSCYKLFYSLDIFTSDIYSDMQNYVFISLTLGMASDIPSLYGIIWVPLDIHI